MSEVRSTVAMNIRRLRAAKGLSEIAVAGAAGLSRAGYRNLEGGTGEPRSATLVRVAKALGAMPTDLLRPAAPLPRARFRSLKRMKAREQLLVDVGRRLADYQQLEAALDANDPYAFATYPEPPASGGPAAVAAAGEIRKLLGLGAKEPIRDICGLLEGAGIKFLRTGVASNDFFGLSVAAGDGGPAIVVNTWQRISVERWIFTAAHELGHLVLHREDFDPDENLESKDKEAEANLFAAHFLMPEGAFFAEWNDTAGLALFDRVLKVKRIFRVSYRTVLYRLQEHGTVDVWKKFQVQAKSRWGRTFLRDDEPKALAADAFRASSPESSRAREPQNLVEADFMDDRLHRLVRTAVERDHISLSRAGEILDKSFAEMRQLAAAWV